MPDFSPPIYRRAPSLLLLTILLLLIIKTNQLTLTPPLPILKPPQQPIKFLPSSPAHLKPGKNDICTTLCIDYGLRQTGLAKINTSSETRGYVNATPINVLVTYADSMSKGLALRRSANTQMQQLQQHMQQQMQQQNELTKKLITKLLPVIQIYKPAQIVIGLPLNSDGTESQQSKLTRRFAGGLVEVLLEVYGGVLSDGYSDGELSVRPNIRDDGDVDDDDDDSPYTFLPVKHYEYALPVYLWDERYSSQSASALLKTNDIRQPSKKDKIITKGLDSLAASIVLDDFIGTEPGDLKVLVEQVMVGDAGWEREVFERGVEGRRIKSRV